MPRHMHRHASEREGGFIESEATARTKGYEETYACRSARQEMEILQELRPQQNERGCWAHVRCKRYLDDRASSSAAVCYRATAIVCYRATTRRAALCSRPRGSPRSHSECAGMAGSYRHCASEPPRNARVSGYSAKVRNRARPIRSLYYRARDKSSRSQSKV